MAARVVRELSSMNSDSRSAGSSGGASYEGTTNGRGEPHGEGRRVFSSGHVYQGQWQDGRCHGFGKFSYPDGQIFEGQWEGGRRNGPGKLMMPGGETIAGNWVDDTLSGAVRRWQTAEEAPPAPLVKRERAPAAAGTMVSTPSLPPSGPAAEAADVQWLRESHDVIWQLNVELQMENERLTGENRRLRLKLRSMLQEQAARPPAQAAKPPEPPKLVEGKLKKKKKDKLDASSMSAIAKLLGDSGLKGGQGSAMDFLASTGKGGQGTVSDFLASTSGPAEAARLSPSERRRKVVDELCERAHDELQTQLRGAPWEAVRRLDSANDVDKYARHVLRETLLRPIRERSIETDAALSDAAVDIRDALSAVVDWPTSLSRIQRHSKLEGSALLRAEELQLDGCALGPAGAGAVSLIIRASRALRKLDLSGNRLGDVGAILLADMLRTDSGLLQLRLHDNGIRGAGGGALAAMLSTNRKLSRVDLRHNAFDHLSESALRSAGGKRVILADHELADASDFLDWGSGAGASAARDADAFLAFADRKDPPPPPPVPPPKPGGARDADAFLAFASGGDASGGGSSARARDADAFLNFRGSVTGGSGGSQTVGNGSDAASFLSFTGSSSGGGGSGGGKSDAADFLSFSGGGGGGAGQGGGRQGGAATSAEAFLSFGSAEGASTSAKADLGSSKGKVTFAGSSTAAPPPSGLLGAGATRDASDFLASLG